MDHPAQPGTARGPGRPGGSGSPGPPGAPGASDGDATPFTEERARALLRAAGIRDAPGAAARAPLLALGENAVFALPDDTPSGPGTVVRVGRTPHLVPRAARELHVAAWLAEHDVPAVRPAPAPPGVTTEPGRPSLALAEGHPLTFWRRLPPAVRQATPADLAPLLRRVHALPAPPPRLGLPRRDLLSGVERWLRLAGSAVPPADAAYLRARRDDCAAALAGLTPALPPGPIHGDALPRNVHVGPDGPVLLDLETFSDDLREHDLVVLDLSHDRYGLDTAAYEDFVRAYGWDVREWHGCAVLRGARETAACAWVAQHAPGDPAARREFARRVASLRDGDRTLRWHTF